MGCWGRFFGLTMSLRRRPTVTPAQLAANRANARKSTGPRTVEGKNRILLKCTEERPSCSQLGRESPAREVPGGGRAVPMDSGAGGHRFSPSRLERGRAEGRPASTAGLVRARPGGASMARFRPAAGQRPREVSAADCHFVGAALDTAPVGRARNKPGIRREINR